MIDEWASESNGLVGMSRLALQLSLHADDARQAALDVRLWLSHTPRTRRLPDLRSIQKDTGNDLGSSFLVERTALGKCC